MILGQLENAPRYLNLNPLFAAAFDFLATVDLAALPPGRRAGPGFGVIVFDGEGLGSEARLEAHRREIDVHFVVAGDESIGWRPTSQCTRELHPYDPQRDLVRFEDAPALWCPLPTGSFAVCFPDDGHAPFGGTGPVRKVILKVPVQVPVAAG